jgi:hypothetical protein
MRKMYCRKCGKYVVGNVDICEDCAKTEENVFESTEEIIIERPTVDATVSTVMPARKTSKTKGIAFGIIGVVVAIIAAIVIGVGYGVAIVGANAAQEGATIEEVRAMLSLGVGICVVGVVLDLVAVIFGPVAIFIFRSQNAYTGVKAVPTLVFGIISLAEGAGVLLMGISYVLEISSVLAQLM